MKNIVFERSPPLPNQKTSFLTPTKKYWRPPPNLVADCFCIASSLFRSGKNKLRNWKIFDYQFIRKVDIFRISILPSLVRGLSGDTAFERNWYKCYVPWEAVRIDSVSLCGVPTRGVIILYFELPRRMPTLC